MARAWIRAVTFTACAIGCLLAIGLTRNGGVSTEVPSQVRTVFLVRHGDTDPKGETDPTLTQAGAERAGRLARVLGDEPLASVFITRTARSEQTGRFTAAHNGIEPTVYAPTAYDELRSQVLGMPGGSASLIVAHSNTVPAIAKAFGGREMKELPEKEFDRLFVLVLEGERLVRMVELRY